MENKIEAFCGILNDNNYVTKVKEIPDEFDHADELKAQIEQDGFIPDSMRYFEVNGYSSPVELEEWLRREYDSFKIAFITETDPNKRKLAFEIHRQITVTKQYLLDLLTSIKPMGDISFESLIKHKIQYCTETLNFVLHEYGDLDDQENDQEPNDAKEYSPVYFFKISTDFKEYSFHKVLQLHKELKNSGYIDCSLREFRKLFVDPNQTPPTQTPQPIKWKKGKYNHLAYLIKCLNENFLGSQRSPSNNQIAIKLFYNSEEGKYFSPNKLRFDGRLGLEPKKTIDTIINHIGIGGSKQYSQAK